MFTNILIVAGLVVLVVAVLNRRALYDFFTAARAQVGKAGRAVRGADPMANYQQTIDDAADAIKTAKQGMQRVIAIINSVKRRVETATQEKAKAEARIKKSLENNDQEKAREYAILLGEIEGNLTDGQEQLKRHEEEYSFFCEEIKKQQRRVERAERDAQSLGVRLEMSQANKELSEFKSSFSTGDALSGLDEHREAVLRQIDANNAASQVDRDTGSVIDDDEMDRNIKADEILKRFQ